MPRDFKPYEQKMLLAIWKEINNPHRLIVPKSRLMVELNLPRELFYATFSRILCYTDSLLPVNGGCVIYPEKFKQFIKEKYPGIYSVVKDEEIK